MRKRFVRLTLAVSMVVCLSGAASAAPDDLQTGTPCMTTDPNIDEVFVYTGASFTGTCAKLLAGFYPNSGTATGGFGLPNDSISSIKVGSTVRARLFTDGVYGGNYFWFGGGTWANMPSGWNDVTSSIRVEVNSRSTTCNDLAPDEYALFRDANYSGDCVVLHYSHGSYPQPIYMGIANDAVSSVMGGPASTCADGSAASVGLYWNGGFGRPVFNVASGTSVSFLSSFNDGTSSLATFCGGVGP